MTQETKLYTRENWAAAMIAMNKGERLEIDLDIYTHFLEVLPPIYMGKHVTLPGGEKIFANFGFAEGWDFVTAFWHEKKDGAERRYFCQKTEQMNPSDSPWFSVRADNLKLAD